MTQLTYLKNVCFHGKYNSKPAGLWTAKVRPRKYEHAISHHAFKQLHFFVKRARWDELKESKGNIIVTDHCDTRNQSQEICCFINQSALRKTVLFSRAYLTPVTRHIFRRLRLVARFGCDFWSGFFLNLSRFASQAHQRFLVFQHLLEAALLRWFAGGHSLCLCVYPDLSRYARSFGLIT